MIDGDGQLNAILKILRCHCFQFQPINNEETKLKDMFRERTRHLTRFTTAKYVYVYGSPENYSNRLADTDFGRQINFTQK